MTADRRNDSEIQRWLDAEAPARAPAGLHDGILRQAGRRRQRPGWLVAVRGGDFRGPVASAGSARRLAYVLVIVGLLLAVALAVVVVGGFRSAPSLGGNGEIVYFYQVRNHGMNGYTRLNADRSEGRAIRPGGCPSYSSDGTLLVYPERGDGNQRLVLEPVDGSAPAVIDIIAIHRSRLSRSYDLSPDSTRVAWLMPGPEILSPIQADGSTYGLGPRSEVWVTPVDGRPGTRIMPMPSAPYEVYGQPVWSPDGHSIAFAAWDHDLVDKEFVLRRAEIVIVEADGSGFRRLPTRTVMSNPVWSPDGRFIAFVGAAEDEPAVDAGGNLFVVNADGTGELKLTDTDGTSAPAWSPDGRELAFLATTGDELPRLTVLPMAEGLPVGPAVSGPATMMFAWSPDATRLLYEDLPLAAGSETTLRTIDRAFAERPSAALASVDGSFQCPLVWQRVSS